MKPTTHPGWCLLNEFKWRWRPVCESMITYFPEDGCLAAVVLLVFFWWRWCTLVSCWCRRAKVACTARRSPTNNRTKHRIMCTTECTFDAGERVSTFVDAGGTFYRDEDDAAADGVFTWSTCTRCIRLWWMAISYSDDCSIWWLSMSSLWSFWGIKRYKNRQSRYIVSPERGILINNVLLYCCSSEWANEFYIGDLFNDFNSHE